MDIASMCAASEKWVSRLPPLSKVTIQKFNHQHQDKQCRHHPSSTRVSLLTKVFPTETSISKSYQRKYSLQRHESPTNNPTNEKSPYKWFPSTGFHRRYSNDSLRHTTWHSWPSWGKSRYRRFNHPLMSCRHQPQDKQCRHHPSSTRVSLTKRRVFSDAAHIDAISIPTK